MDKKDKPPLLSNEEMKSISSTVNDPLEIISVEPYIRVFWIEQGAKAQREADIAYYSKEARDGSNRLGRYERLLDIRYKRRKWE